MKKVHLFFCLALPLFMWSCTKEIVIDLDTAEPKLVVESIVTDNVEPYKVKLTETAPYFSQGEVYVTNATVVISDNVGNVDTLTYIANGVYSTITNRQGVVGNTYNLLVNWNGVNYTSTETMPVKVNLDTISYVYQEASAFQEEGYITALNAQDVAGYANRYRFSFYKNDTLQTDPFKYFVVDDQFSDGNYITAFTPYVYQTGDTCRIEILSITKPYYMFLLSLSAQVQASGGPFDPIPSNPPSNISNGALGFFAAAPRSTKSIVLP
ncbi:MAG TPA: DUF4249 domain-containing protein [Flavobacteriales bacterium]|nr:DUF4249 domain-containing protein [Flavobacteriales bacterium]